MNSQINRIKPRSWAAAVCMAFAGVLGAASSADAYVIDTGGLLPSTTVPAGGLSLNTTQSIAGRFTTTADYFITSIEGWIGRMTAGDLTVSIYSDGAGSAVPGQALFSQQVAVPGANNPGYSIDFTDWVGIAGLNWLLNAGTYWAVFEVQDGSSFTGVMPSGAFPNGNNCPPPVRGQPVTCSNYTDIVPNPLSAYSTFYELVYNTWQPNNGAPVGVRIDGLPVGASGGGTGGSVGGGGSTGSGAGGGDSNAVPEPQSPLLMALALLAVVLVPHFRRRSYPAAASAALA